MLPTRGLLHQHGENAWYHISSRGPTTKLRRVDREAPALIFRLPNDEERLLKILETSDVFSLGEIAVAASPYLEFPSRGFPHDERGKWLEVAELLIDVQPSRSASEVPENPVPITRLRRFYETLRLFPTMAVRSSILGYLTRDSDSADILGALFADSLAHLNSYRNVDEGFRPSSVRSWWPDYVDRHEAFARCLVARLSPERHPGPIRIAGSSPMEFAVVDYEVSPLRTPGGRKFDDGTAARRSGAGGVDLLCASRDGLPVIGEIKAPTDTSPLRGTGAVPHLCERAPYTAAGCTTEAGISERLSDLGRSTHCRAPVARSSRRPASPGRRHAAADKRAARQSRWGGRKAYPPRHRGERGART